MDIIIINYNGFQRFEAVRDYFETNRTFEAIGRRAPAVQRARGSR